MKKQSIEEQAEAIFLPLVQEHGFELVDVEYVREGTNWYLRAYIDKEGGISVDDCELISRQAEPILDEQDIVSGAYILEVSSPGLTRPLKKDRDYERNLGKPVEVRTFRPVDGDKEFIGDLLRYDKDTIVLDVGQEDAEEITIERKNISVIKQYFVF